MIKKLRVTVDGKSFDVTVEVPDESEPGAPTSALPGQPNPSPSGPGPTLAAPPAPPASLAAAAPGDVPSPLAGRVAAIVVKPGQDVKEGEHLLTLEAMKMNTFVFAPKSGKISEIKVAVGDAVGEGQALIKLA